MILPLAIDNMSAMQQAYETVTAQCDGVKEPVTNLCKFIAAGIVIYQGYGVVSESLKEGNTINMKSILDICKFYIGVVAAIFIAPFVIKALEMGFTDIANSLTATANESIAEDVNTTMKEWIQNDTEAVKDKNFIMSSIMKKLDAVSRALAIIPLMIERSIFTLFMSARYLYLIILECFMPFAIAFAIGKETRAKFTEPFMKNLFCCYMLIPVFIIANNFADALIGTVNTFVVSFMQSDGSMKEAFSTSIPRWVISWLQLIFKFYLFGKAGGYVRQIF